MKEAVGLAHPFTVTVVIHSAHNLAIADFTTSDPYVILQVDKKEIGRTPTIFRNLNPVWESKFVIPLTHVHSTLTFRIFDEDSGKNDDIMGVVTVDLCTLYMNEVLEKKYPLRQRDDAPDLAKGKLSFSVFIEKCETLIRIEKNDAASHYVSHEMSAMLKEEIDNCLGQTANGSFVIDSAPIFMTMMKSPFLKAGQEQLFQVVNKGLLRDLMCDVRSLLRCLNVTFPSKALPVARDERKSSSISAAGSKDFISVAEDLLPMTLLRSRRALHSSTRLDAESGEYTSHSPIPEAVIMLEFKDKSQCRLIFPDRKNYYLIWVWMKWLKLVSSIQKGELRTVSASGDGKNPEPELPSWAGSGKLTSSLTVVLKSSAGVEVRNLHYNHFIDFISRC
jgi:C2 domain